MQPCLCLLVNSYQIQKITTQIFLTFFADHKSSEICRSSQEYSKEYIDSIEEENTNLKQTLQSLEEIHQTEVKNYHEKLRKLKEELQAYMDARCCKICLDKDISCLNLPCKHLVMCEDCAYNNTVKECPICRKPIMKKMKGIIIS